MSSNNCSISRCRKRLPLTRAATKQKELNRQLKKQKYNGLSPTTKKIRKDQDDVVVERAFKELLTIRFTNGGKKHNDIQAIIDEFKNKGRGTVERWHLEYRLRSAKIGKYVKNAAPIPKELFLGPDLVTDISPLTGGDVDADDDEESLMDGDVFSIDSESEDIGDETRRGGRVQGSNKTAKKQHIFKVQRTITSAATRCCVAKAVAVNGNRKVVSGTYKSIILEEEMKANLRPGTINYETIRSRILANNPSGSCHQKISPLYLIEPIIVDFCCELSKIGEALIKEEIMELVDDMIRSTKHEVAIREFCLKRNIKKNEEGPIVGERWYRNFLKRYNHRLRRAKCKIMDINRKSFCTYENFANMYNCVYDKMVEAGVAVKLDEETMFRKDGSITQDPSEMYGRPSRYQIIKPERCVFVDETGCNTNCKKDGYTGGQQHISGIDQIEGGRTSVATDLHFTVLAFTSGTGEPIMCAVILKSEKNIEDIPISWTFGIDVSKNVVTGGTDIETYILNSENGVATGGPKCFFQGKEISTFVCCSPNASITSDLLAQMLKEIDSYDIFGRSHQDGVPFLLLDGHHSRTRLPFLDYITNPNHPWMVCIGVPYGTHLWQVHDSSELNGSFKIKLSKAKKEYLESKPRGGRQTFVTSDIIPIINKTWEMTLGNRVFASKAIAERGWGPLTYKLLDHPNFKESDLLFHPIDKNANLIDLETVNHGGKAYEKRLDQLVEERLKSDARRVKYNGILSEAATKLSNIAKISELMSLRSGDMCNRNKFCVSDNEIRDRLIEIEREKQKKHNEALDKKVTAAEKQQAKFRFAAQKFFNREHLHCDDLRAILKEIWVKGDGPLKTKYDDLFNHLESRKGRMEKYNVFRNNARIDNNCEEIIATAIDVANANSNPIAYSNTSDPMAPCTLGPNSNINGDTVTFSM